MAIFFRIKVSIVYLAKVGCRLDLFLEKKFPKSNFNDKYQHFCRIKESYKLKDAKKIEQTLQFSLENQITSLRKRQDFRKIMKRKKKVAKLI